MTLRIRYDDGFIAYLNGTEIARRNAPTDPVWNSQAVVDQPDEQAIEFAEIDVTDYVGLLQSTGNVLAIQGLNRTPDDVDFLLETELFATDTSIVLEGQFFDESTPGDSNLRGRAGVMRPPTISLDGMIFMDSLTVELITDQPGAEIRFTTDGTKPSEESMLYTVPISISRTTQVRAQTFRANHVPSQIVSETYLKLGADLQGFTSDLPIMIIDTLQTGVAEANVASSYVALFEPQEDGRTSLTGDPAVTSRAGLKIRGSSTVGFAKRSYALELWNDASNEDRDLSLLGLPAESDWVLNSPFLWDRSLTRNPFIYELSNQVGRYATRTRYFELFVNSNRNGELRFSPDYQGVYVLIEKIKRGPDRVDVQKLPAQYSAEPEISGGYIVKVDRPDPGDSGFRAGGLDLFYVEPKEVEIEQRPAQRSWLTNYINTFTAALSGPNFTHPTLGTHYGEYIDIQSFVDHHILNELTSNIDALRLSTYMFKPREGLLEAGPVWDFDRSMDSNDLRDDDPRGWYQDRFFGWYNRMFQDPDFQQRWIDRWQQWRHGPFSVDNVNSIIDNLAGQITEAQVRNFARWPGAGPRTAGGFISGELNGTWQGEVEHQKEWLTTRLEWYDGQFLQRPTFSRGSGVISRPFGFTLSGPAGTTVFFTTDGTDPRLPGGGISPAAIEYTAAVEILGNTRITARSYQSSFNTAFSASNEPWSSPQTAVFTLESPPPLRITEVNYNPHEPTTEELAVNPTFNNDDFEFIEIQNVGSDTVNLVGVRLSAGVEFNFPAMNLADGEYAIVVKNQTAFEARYGTGINVTGEFTTGSLSDNGEKIELVDALDAVIHQFQYSDSGAWPGRGDGQGSSLEVVDTDGNYNLANNWRDSFDFSGSPGSVGSQPSPSVIVNEVLAHTDPPQVDTIELFNTLNEPINVSHWYLSDSSDNYHKFRIPQGTIIPAGGYLTFDEGDFNRSSGVDPNDFALSSFSDDVWLLSADADGKLLRFIDHVQFDATLANVSLGRLPNGSFNSDLIPQIAPSLGSVNQGHRSGELVISEVHYNPSGAGTGLEFIELYNATGAAIDLGSWRLDGGVDFDLPVGTMIPPAETVVLVAYDPRLEVDRDSAFRTAYGIDAAVVLVGPWQTGDVLDNGGSILSLQRQHDELEPDQIEFEFILIDQVNYDDDSPWPFSPNAQGDSLNRRAPVLFGNDFSMWMADTPSPGSVDFSAEVLGDFNGDRRVNARDIDLLYDVVNVSSVVDYFDLDRNNAVGQTDVDHLVLTILDTVFGDADLDHDVDLDDGFALISGFGGGPSDPRSWSDGNFDGDDDVDQDDGHQLRNHFGQAKTKSSGSRRQLSRDSKDGAPPFVRAHVQIHQDNHSIPRLQKNSGARDSRLASGIDGVRL